MAQKFWVGGGVTTDWNSSVLGVTNWADSSGGLNTGTVPGASDDVIFDGNSFTDSVISADISVHSIQTAGTLFVTLTHNAGVTVTITGDDGAYSLFLDDAGGLTYVLGNPTTSALKFTGTSGTPLIYTGGFSLGNITFDGVGGSWQFAATALTMAATATIILTNGTVDFNVSSTFGKFSSSNSNTREVILSASIVLTGTGTVWDATVSTNLTISGSQSLEISDTSSTSKTFAGGGLTYFEITFSGDNIIVSGSNTFTTFNVNNAGLTNGLKLTSGTTQTVSLFTTNGSAGNLAKLLSTSSGSQATLSGGGGVSVDYMSIKDSAAIGGTWNPGVNSTDGGNNSGWLFTPTAAFTGTPTTITVGQTVTFTDQSTNTPTSWSWVFAGGTPATSNAQNPVIQYNTAGTYDVTLTASNGGGSSAPLVKTNYITVEEAPDESGGCSCSAMS